MLAAEPRRGATRAPRDGGQDEVARARLERLDAEVARLGREANDLRAELSAIRGALLATAPPQGPEGKGVEAYLEEYVRSFDGGGGGSEYFRLVVEAYAPALRDAILRVIAGHTAPPALKASLIRMLGRAELRGDARVLGTLVAALRDGPPPEVAQALVQALGVIGDARTAATLEGLAFDLPAPARAAAIAVAVHLSGEGANGLVRRLLSRAPDSATLHQLVALLGSGDEADAVEALREASRLETPARLDAAKKLGSFRGEGFRRLIDDWLGYEQEPVVKAALEQAKARQDLVPSWHALKATGPPDAEADKDHPNAWAPLHPDAGAQWLELTYDPPRRASAIRIHEVNVAGGVTAVETVDEGGRRRTVWQGQDPTAMGGVFEVPFAPTDYRVRRVRILLDTGRRPGWEEVDAVELLGPDGRAWAQGAAASTTYGQ